MPPHQREAGCESLCGDLTPSALVLPGRFGYNELVQISFVIGPAGSGKSYRCLKDARRALSGAPEGLPLLFVAPKQSTYEVERRLLEEPGLAGYTRLQVLSFERLSRFVFEQALLRPPDMLDEEGRIMVLRSLLSSKRDRLKLFRASARLTGFASQLASVLCELRRQQATPVQLRQAAAGLADNPGLGGKLEDLAMLLEDYSEWLERQGLLDDDSLVSAAVRALSCREHAGVKIEKMWVDGFLELAPLELELIAALAPFCGELTLTFCLESVPQRAPSWLQHWAPPAQSFLRCRERLALVPGADLRTEVLARKPGTGRFSANPALRHLEACWSDPRPFEGNGGDGNSGPPAVRLVHCADPEAEVRLAAREILKQTRGGRRFRDISVLLRQLDSHHSFIQREFARYEIPFFVDRRESMAHHPLAELTRSALRVLALRWRHDDLFAALKTGLVPLPEEEVDFLENEALARGWLGSFWEQDAPFPDEPDLDQRLKRFRREALTPFRKLAATLTHGRATGRALAAGLRSFWRALDVESTLLHWAAEIPGGAGWEAPAAAHATVWEQAELWLQNLELAFPREALPIREWLPILESGLAGLSVGVIPPALDQVIVGAVDRSRNPESEVAIVLGWNEGVFPAPPNTPGLLSEADRAQLEGSGLVLGGTARLHLGRERHLAYLACTRARSELLLTFAAQDAEASPLNPSIFLSTVRELFPNVPVEKAPPTIDPQEAEHPSELAGPLLQMQLEAAGQCPEHIVLPGLRDISDRLRGFRPPVTEEALAPELVEQLYGRALRTSVSRLEQFAACPFRFFLHSGLRAEVRGRFELDARERGSFQHDVLAAFHDELRAEGKRWRDLTPEQAAEKAGRIAEALAQKYRDGLLTATEETRLTARLLGRALQKCIATLVGWMREQYPFDPEHVELPFGEQDSLPPWTVDLGEGKALQLRGRIDRLDVYRIPGSNEAQCLVIDYKSSQKRLDEVLMANGLQLQLPAYLSVVRHLLNAREWFGVERLVPIGVFYLNLKGNFGRESHRTAAIESAAESQRQAYAHRGRFDRAALRNLDTRDEATSGDQFCYRLKKDGEVYASCSDPLPTDQFQELIASTESCLADMGRRVYAGEIKMDPYKRGNQIACTHCDFMPVCRIDPWTHVYRKLNSNATSDA